MTTPVHKGIFALILAGLLFGLIGCPSEPPPPTEKPTTEAKTPPLESWIEAREKARNRTTVTSFRQAKKRLLKLYAEANMTTTFYCGCTYTEKKPDLNSCGVVPRKQPKRANRIEWEHVMPISLLGRTLACWSNGGRKNCGKVDPFFKRAEADLHNLVPAVGEVNGDRSNYPPVEEIAGEVRKYGACDVEIQNKTFEPPPHRRGDIARTYLYMEKVYGAPLTNGEIAMFTRWH